MSKLLTLIISLAISLRVDAKVVEQASPELNKIANSQPNIIIILTDDMGYADLDIQGQVGDLITPHLDNLAETGVRMTAGSG